MVKINGVKANNIFDIDTKKQKKPTLNQILAVYQIELRIILIHLYLFLIKLFYL